MSLLAIPPALLLLVPPFAFYAVATHPTSRLARLSIVALAFFTLLAAALGLASSATSRLSLYHAEMICATFLRCILGACAIYLINVALPRHFSKFYLYNIVLVVILLCATLISLMAPFLTQSNLPLVAAVLTLVSPVLPFCLFVLLRLDFGRSNPSLPLTPHREKSFQTMRDEPVTAYHRTSNEDHSPNILLDQPEDASGTFYAFFVCAQIAAILASALGIRVHTVVLSGSDDIGISAAVVEIIQSTSTVVWVFCIMSALLIYPRPSTDSALSYFTPQPSRIVQSWTPPTRSYCPCPTRGRHPLTMIPTPVHSSTPMPCHLTEDFLNLRDPFAPPNVGVAVGTSLGVMFTPSTGVGPNPAAPHSPPRTKSNARLKTRPSSASQTTRRSKRKASLSPRISAPAITPASEPTLKPAEDIDFDPEEAFLTQLLLRNLDAGIPSAGVQPQSPTRSCPRAPAVHRFTQDSTSTGRTLCESETFRLPRGSLSTEVGSACVSTCAGASGSAEQSESPSA